MREIKKPEVSRILFLSQVLPYPLDTGPKIRSYYTLRHLTEHHQVTLVAFTRPDDSQEASEHLQQFCSHVYTVPIVRSRSRDILSLARSWLGRGSFIILRDSTPAMQTLVDRLMRPKAGSENGDSPFKAVHADQLWMAQYALQGKKAAPGVKLVLDEHNACFRIFQRLSRGESNPLKRLALEREWRALRTYEGWACTQFDHLVTVTEQNRATLQSLMQKTRGVPRMPQTEVIPICVDPRETQAVESIPEARDVLHLGTMFWAPNVEGVCWFGDRVWPRVVAQVPEATFTIVGKNPPQCIRRLANSVSNPKSDTKACVEVTGYVDDPDPYLEACGAFIVPLHTGSGMRVKIVEAWARGLPVISTTVGAEGLCYRHEENILIADGEEAFAEAVIRLLKDTSLNQRLRQNGRRWVEENYDWRVVYTAWDKIYAPGNAEQPS